MRLIRVVFLTPLIVAAVWPCWCQQTQASKPIPDSLITKLHSKYWAERHDALDGIRSDQTLLHSREIQALLIDLLNEELSEDGNSNSRNAASEEDQGEEFAEYFASLRDMVGSFVNWRDSTQVCMMVNAAYIDYPSSVPEAAARAKAAMPCILKRAEDRQPINRAIAISMLVEALARGKKALDSETIRKAKQIILNDLHDSDVGLRAGAVVAVANYGEADVIPVLQEIANSDPAFEKTDNGGTWFPIRDSATKAITEIRRREAER